MNQPRPNRPWAMLLLGCVLMLTGCEGFSFISQAFSSTKIKPVYNLANRPTLVLVDDPDNQLGDPGMSNLIAGQISQDFREKKVVTQTIATGKVDALRQQYGQGYNKLPIDQVGREIGAEQVVYVQVMQASLNPEPGLIRPTASVRVKVIDAPTGQRLFPESSTGHPVEAALARMDGRDFSQGQAAVLRRDLSLRIARDAGRLFYKYPARKAGEGSDD